jgi:hypothetical protein
MDAKITLSFDKSVIRNAKRYAEENNISLSRLTEFLLRRAVGSGAASLEDLPISEWVHMVAEGEVEYKTKARKRKEMKDEYYNSKK